MKKTLKPKTVVIIAAAAAAVMIAWGAFGSQASGVLPEYTSAEDRSAGDEKPARCLACGSANVATIVYGMIVDEDGSLEEQIDNGEIVRGGCCISPESSRWECNDCHHRFGELNEGER